MPLKTIIFSLFFCLILSASYAQKQSGSIGLGLQLGQPTGITAMFYKSSGPSVDLLLAWDLGDFFFLNGHLIWEKSIRNVNLLNFYYGPGAFIGFSDNNDRDGLFDNTNDDIIIGISGRIGLSVDLSPFELFAHLTPRIALSSSSNIGIGGGLGGRFYF